MWTFKSKFLPSDMLNFKGSEIMKEKKKVSKSFQAPTVFLSFSQPHNIFHQKGVIFNNIGISPWKTHISAVDEKRTSLT